MLRVWAPPRGIIEERPKNVFKSLHPAARFRRLFVFILAPSQFLACVLGYLLCFFVSIDLAMLPIAILKDYGVIWGLFFDPFQFLFVGDAAKTNSENTS